MNKLILYKVVSCNVAGITLQSINKSTIFHVSWKEIFLPEYICTISNSQIFFLGTYYAHNLRNLNLESIFNIDSEIQNVKKLILSEIKTDNYILMDIKTNKIETLNLKFLLSNIELLNDFTSIQTFFFGIRAGSIYDKSNIK